MDTELTLELIRQLKIHNKILLFKIGLEHQFQDLDRMVYKILSEELRR